MVSTLRGGAGGCFALELSALKNESDGKPEERAEETRPDEQPLIEAAQGLQFLVLDELHTYRGRQGADVALRRSLTEEELFRWCIDQLPYFALPRYIEFRAELPRSPVGRVLKRELRAEGVTPSTWDADAAGISYEKR